MPLLFAIQLFAIMAPSKNQQVDDWEIELASEHCEMHFFMVFIFPWNPAYRINCFQEHMYNPFSDAQQFNVGEFLTQAAFWEI